MLDLKAWVDRLTGYIPCEPQLILDDEQAKNVRGYPCVLISPGQEQVAHSETSAMVRHRVTSEVLIVYGVAKSARGHGELSRDALHEIRKPVLERLLNWTPPGADTPVIWMGGELLQLNNQGLYWADVLTTDYWWTP